MLQQVRYTGHLEKTLADRQLRLRSDCREGHASVVSILINLLSVIISVSLILICDQAGAVIGHVITSRRAKQRPFTW